VRNPSGTAPGRLPRGAVRIHLREPSDCETAVIDARIVAAAVGFRPADQVLIATAVSELATNILRYAGTGEIRIDPVRDGRRTGVRICAEDAGPGIRDVEEAMREGFTTCRGSLGLGLPSVRRVMEEFHIRTSAQGTRIEACKWFENPSAEAGSRDA